MKKKYIKEKLAALGSYNFEGPIDNIIQMLENLKTKNHKNIRIDYEYFSDTTNFVVTGERLETDNELEKRKKKIQKQKELKKKQKAEQKKREYKEYLKLKEKFEKE